MSPDALVECVPNFSEGRDNKKIEAIASAIRSVSGVRLLNVDPGSDTNRTVYTFIGTPNTIVEAALAGAREARRIIDMRSHRGAHPRIGALDVCPFVPVSGITMDECVEVSRRFGSQLAEELGIPVYLYEKSATISSRMSLADIRSGEYEGLATKLTDPLWAPDFGPAVFDPSWGATVTGAREFLIAYNVNLNTRDKKLASDIACSIREAGRMGKDEDGSPVRLPGLLKSVRAIGWYIEEYRCAQVSVNLLDFTVTPLHAVFETIKSEAEKRGVLVTGSELIGLVPLKAIKEAGRHFLQKMGKCPGLPDNELVEIAVHSMGLSQTENFDPDQRIVEWAYGERGKLVSLNVRDFVDLVSSDSPVPGGGSVAALSGALGAGLAAMTGNLTFGKKGYEGYFQTVGKMAEEAQTLKDALLEAVDEDTDAFNAVLVARRMPQGDDAQSARRKEELLNASEWSARVPMKTARSCLAALKLCDTAVRKGNRNSITDAAMGAIMAASGVEGALLNVLINLASLEDESLKQNLVLESEVLREEAMALKARILDFVSRRMDEKS
jgi:glutamate formiminotransferase/formiminotetrahydrofolate cyclodeaminase